MLPIEIKKDVFWVGAVDFSSMDFHGYSISPHGTTYNNYLIKDDKTVLVDTVKEDFFEDAIKNIERITGSLEKIDYIIINHVELDHSGCLDKFVELCKPEKIFCSVMGKSTMERHFDVEGWPIVAVKTGDSINIGKRNIKFIETRMIHWPDSMFSYIEEDKILFTNDAFGQNIASTERYFDELPRFLVDHALSEYYHNIVLPFSPRVKAVLKQIGEMNIPIDVIAPDHGLIYRTPQDVAHVINKYADFAEQKPKKRAVIFFDTMWHSTQKMADAIAAGLADVGVPARIINLKQHHHSIVMTELAHCGLVIGGSPTHNNGVLPFVAGMLTYMKGLKPKHRIGASFGSFGWSGEAPLYIQREFESMGMKTPIEPMKLQYVPKDCELEECVEMGRKLGRELIKMVEDANK